MVPAVIVAACVLHNITLRNDRIVADVPPEAIEQESIIIDVNIDRNRREIKGFYCCPPNRKLKYI